MHSCHKTNEASSESKWSPKRKMWKILDHYPLPLAWKEKDLPVGKSIILMWSWRDGKWSHCLSSLVSCPRKLANFVREVSVRLGLLWCNIILCWPHRFSEMAATTNVLRVTGHLISVPISRQKWETWSKNLDCILSAITNWTSRINPFCSESITVTVAFCHMLITDDSGTLSYLHGK